MSVDREPRRAIPVAQSETALPTEQAQARVLFQAEASYYKTRFSDPMGYERRREILLDSHEHGLTVHVNFNRNSSPEGIKLDKEIQALRDQGKRVVVTIAEVSETPHPKVPDAK